MTYKQFLIVLKKMKECGFSIENLTIFQLAQFYNNRICY